MNCSTRIPCAALALALASLSGLPFRPIPADAGKPGQPAVGKSASPAGVLLRCTRPGKSCRALEPAGDVRGGDLLVALPGTRAEVELRGGTVRLSLLGHLPTEADESVLESAVRLNADGAEGLDLSLAAGRALLANRGKKGAVKVRVRIEKEVLKLELEPQTEVALELISRWPPGAPFSTEAKPERRPVTGAVMALIKGEINARFNDGDEHSGLRGKVAYVWNSVTGPAGPAPLKELPAWATAAPAAPEKAVAAALAALRERLAAKDAAAALRGAGAADAPEQRVVAVYGAAALHDHSGVLKGLEDAKDAKVRRAAARALRHCIGRSAAEDVRVYEALVTDGYKPGQAEIAMHLLHGFTRAALDEPLTYETLIQYLGHGRLGVRELAAEHLERLVPQGRKIGYDAAAAPEARARARAAWRKLIPEGKLPPTAPK
jgi:hypothetical protein